MSRVGFIKVSNRPIVLGCFTFSIKLVGYSIVVILFAVIVVDNRCFIKRNIGATRLSYFSKAFKP